MWKTQVAVMLAAGPYLSCIQGLQINLMTTEALNACMKFLSQWSWHFWIFPPKWRTGNGSFNNLHNKGVQMLEVASNELSSNITENDEFNNLYWSIRGPSCRSFAPWCPQGIALVVWFKEYSWHSLWVRTSSPPADSVNYPIHIFK